MDFKFSNDAKEPASAAPADKGRQNMLLVVLLILVAAFAYLYFFTGLIKPQEAQKPAEAPAPQAVKKPLPPRDGQTAKDEAAGAPKKDAAAAPEAKKVAAEKPAAEAPVTAKEEPKKATPQKPEPAKPAPAAKKPATPEKKTAQAGAKEPKAAAAPKADEKKPIPAAKQQPGPAVKKPAPAQENNKKAAETAKAASAKTPAKAAGKAPAGAPTSAAATKKSPPAAPKKVAVKSAPAKANGPWTVVVGNYVLEDAMATDLARVKGVGLETAVKQGDRRKTAMNRLLAGDYPTRVAAQAELEKLKHYTSDAFMLEQGGKFAVYAGSYLLATRADSEKERLAAAGVNLTVHHAEVSIPSKYLTAGTFNDKKAADAALKKLKDLGFKATLTSQ